MDDGEVGGEEMGGWSVGGKEGRWELGGKRESKGRIEVRLPPLLSRALDNARNQLSGKGNSAKDGTLTCI